MKKQTFTLIALLACLLTAPDYSRATTINVEVKDFEFDPSTFIANAGDTIHWFWQEGIHTTTSFIIPPGAAAWNQPISSGMPTYDYVVTVSGSYDYICSPHASMGMTGSFTVIGATGIAEAVQPSLNILSGFVKDGALSVIYSTVGNEPVNFSLYDIVGHLAYESKFENKIQGVHTDVVDVASLPNGIYVLYLATSNARSSRKMVIE